MQFPSYFPTRYNLCRAPVGSSKEERDAFLRFIEDQSNGFYVELGVHLPSKSPRTPGEFAIACQCYRIIDLYLWLSVRYPAFYDEAEDCPAHLAVLTQYIDDYLQLREDSPSAGSYKHWHTYPQGRASSLSRKEHRHIRDMAQHHLDMVHPTDQVVIKKAKRSPPHPRGDRVSDGKPLRRKTMGKKAFSK